LIGIILLVYNSDGGRRLHTHTQTRRDAVPGILETINELYLCIDLINETLPKPEVPRRDVRRPLPRVLLVAAACGGHPVCVCVCCVLVAFL